MAYKPGDKVRVVKRQYGHSYEIGSIWEISHISEGDIYFIHGSGGYTRPSELVPVEITFNSMSLKDSFTLAFKNEPEKSFRKAGITNGDDFLTEDGQHIFLSWLLKKYGEEFKKEVVDGLLEDIEKKDK